MQQIFLRLKNIGKLRGEITSLLSRIPIDFGGGCSVSKAYVMAYLIRRFDLKTTLDIGVYRGRSLFPQALAHAGHTGGVAYGVDPWSNAEAKENDNLELKDKIDEFLSVTDFNEIYSVVENFNATSGLSDHCKLVRKTSADAISDFIDSDIFFDLIHIDGNHDTDLVMSDVNLYLPRLKPDGFLVLDDVSWDSVKPAYDALGKKMCRIYERVDDWNDYSVFWNTPASSKVNWLRTILKFVGRG